MGIKPNRRFAKTFHRRQRNQGTGHRAIIVGKVERHPLAMNQQVFPGPPIACIGIGGGGMGDPMHRAAALVARDVTEGLVSAGAAQNLYGVVVSPEGGKVDLVETERLRAAPRAG